MRLDEAQTGMIRKIKGNRGRATMDEKDYELLHRSKGDIEFGMVTHQDGVGQHHPRSGQTVHDPVGTFQAHQGAGTGAGGGDRPALAAGHPLHAGR